MDLTAWKRAQESVIGALLIDPDYSAGLIFQSAKASHFGETELRHVFEAARELWNENRQLDAVTILDRAGSEYEQLLRDCMINTPTASGPGGRCSRGMGTNGHHAAGRGSG